MRIVLALAPLQTPWEMKSSGFPRPRLPESSTHEQRAAPPVIFSLGNKIPRLVSIHAESTGFTGVFEVRSVLEGSGRDADPCQRQLLGPFVLAKNDCSSAHRRGAAPPPCFEQRAPGFDGTMQKHPTPRRLPHRLTSLDRAAGINTRGPIRR